MIANIVICIALLAGLVCGVILLIDVEMGGNPYQHDDEPRPTPKKENDK